MSRQIIFAEEAKDDLVAIREWFNHPGAGGKARIVIRAITAAIATLADFPFIGREGVAPGTREHVVRRHRIIYRVRQDTIVIVAIFGPGQRGEGQP